MQLKKSKSIRNTLTLATSSMLAASMQPLAAETGNAWEVDTALLLYSEKDRVSVAEPVAMAKKEIAEDEFLSVKLVLDSLTGSSPNGAIPQPFPQTFSSPSGSEPGEGGYTTPANETPLDPSFHDTRGALNVAWDKPLNETLRGIFSANLSQEFDYTSVGLSTQFAWDFNQHNTTLTTGLSYNFDQVRPVGGAPVGLSAMPTTLLSAEKSIIAADESKNVGEVLLGVTQVLGRKTLTQLNYVYGTDSGYLTDPYKILSVLTTTGNLRPLDPYLYEKRPDSRTRQAVYWKTLHQFDEDVVDFSYRYYWDDWGITSHTFDVKYRYEFDSGHYLQPHVRLYSQDAADFYNYNLTDGQIPEFASADYRLGKMTTTTAGLKYGIPMGKSSEFSIRAEKINQSVDAAGPVPDMDATMLQMSYSFLF